MATPPDPSKPAKPAPAPRRSTRKATAATPVTPRVAPAKAASEPKVPSAAKPVAKRATTRKAVPPATAPTPKAKPGPKPKAKSATKAAPKSATVGRKSFAAALPALNPKAAWSLGAVALAAGAGIAAFLTRGRIGALLSGKPAEGHVPTDLLDPGHAAQDRATVDFRPDMAAPMSPAERAALAPATLPSSN